MRYTLTSSMLLVALPFLGISQTIDVSGTVLEAGTETPLIGVNVFLRDSTYGTATDFDGSFVLSGVPLGSTLSFTYLGYQAQDIPVTGTAPIEVLLQPDAQSLEEVVVIGYSTAKQREVTGAVATLDNETIENLRAVKVEQALQGTVAGVNVTSQSGSPGAGLDIRIRGVSTNGQNAPTVIIDGYIGDLSLLNPNDIETITVLKDAQAAIYGTIGANGIILVTTKSGKKNMPTTVTYDGNYGLQETSRKIPVLNATEYALLLNESYVNNGQAPPFPNVSGLGTGTDWQDEVFETAPLWNHNLAVSGGSDNITYSIGGSYVDQEGIVGPEKSNFERYTGRLNLGIDLTDDLKLSTAFIYNNSNRSTLLENALGSVLFNALNYSPVYSLNQEDTTGFLGNEVINPLSQIDNTYNEFFFNRLSGTVSGELTWLQDFKLTGRIGFNTSNSRSRNFTPIYDYGAGKVFNVDRSRVDLQKIVDNDYTFDLFNTYKNTYWDNHNFEWTLGMQVYKQTGEGLGGSRLDVQNNSFEFADFSTATGVGEDASNFSYAYDERRLSYFTRIQYNYRERYLLSFMLRRDASTRFGPNNRVAWFPSVTAGWIFKDSENTNDFFRFGKLRGSYGVLGNDQIGNNLYVGQLNGEATYVIDGQLTNGNAIGVLPNPDLQWEEARKFDVGLDLRFLDNALSITTDYFINNRENLLIGNTPVSGILGTAAPGGGSPTVNAGSVRNQGWEFAVTYNDNIGKDLSLTVNYNLTTLDNEVTQINGADFLEGGAFSVGQPAPARMEVGFPLGYFYGFQTDGIFQTAGELESAPSQTALGGEAQLGDIRYVDINNDGVIDFNDRTNIGDPIPDLTMGLNLNLNWKNFDFITYLFGSFGNDIVRNYERNQPNVNRLEYQLNRWTGPGSGNEVPRVTTGATSNNVFSDRFVEDASYVRIQNIQIGYSLPVDFLEKIRIRQLRLYAGVQNLYTFTEYRGYDPSASTGQPIGGGIDFGFYPLPRTYIFGVNMKF